MRCNPNNGSNMKKRCQIICALTILLLVTTSGCASSGGKAPAVLEQSFLEAITGAVAAVEKTLKNGTEIALADVEATPVKLARHIEKELSEQFKKSGKLAVQGRGAELARLIEELNFQMSGYVSDDSMVSITHTAGVKSMVFGSFDDLGGFYQFRVRVLSEETSTVEVAYSARIRKNDPDISGLLGNSGKNNRSVKEEAIACYNRGIDNLVAGVSGPAIEEFSKAIKIDPMFTAAYIRRGVAYNSQHEKVKAKADFDSAIKLDGNSFLAYLNRGAVQNDRTSAIADYTKAIEIDPDYVPAYIYRGYAYKWASDYDHAIADYTTAIRLKPNDINFYYLRAEAYEYKKDYDREIADFANVIRIKPDDALAYYLRGDAYFFDKKDYKNALTAYTTLIGLFPNESNARYIRGRTYLELKDYQRAIADWTDAIRLNPNFTLAYVRRGLVLLETLKDYDKAIADYTKAIGIKRSADSEYQKKLIPNIIENEEDQVALLTVTGAINTDIAFDPEYLYYFRAIAYHNKGDIDKTIADYGESLRIKPTFDSAFNRGLLYIDRNNFAGAIADFTAALKIKQNDIESLKNRGYANFHKNDYNAALADFNAVLKINPKDVWTLLNRGITYINMGGDKYSFTEAERLAQADWKEVLKIEPGNAQAEEWLAVKYWW